MVSVMSLLPVSCNHLGYFFQTQIIKPYRKFNPGVFTLKNMKIRYQKGSRERLKFCDGKNNVYRSKMKHCCVRFLAACGFYHIHSELRDGRQTEI